ncbi:hypothetical protein BH11PLA2_BH11PLA2_21470 [soil metagenome]
MYSLVLMTALAGTPSTSNFNGYFKDLFHGNSSCNGTSNTAATASCSGCSGCSGGSHLFSGDRVRALFSFGGNSCSGSASNSCTGASCSGSSCNGGQMYASSCNGCNGSYAMMNCSGGVFMDSSPYAQPIPASFYSGGCFGGTAMPSQPYSGLPIGPIAPTTIPPTSLPMGDGTTPYAQPAPAEVSEYSPKNQLPLPGGAASSPTRATVIVKLPADARLFAEGKALSLTGTERTFVSPELPVGREYTYTFKIEYDRNGRTLSDQQNIKVTPGKVNTLEFADLLQKSDAIPVPTPVPVPMPKSVAETIKQAVSTPTSMHKADATATTRANIQVKLPAGATLFVNDAKQLKTEFTTPPLPTGKEFHYTMKIEVVRNGYPESVTQKVTIRAGDTTTVDFTNSGETRSVSR